MEARQLHSIYSMALLWTNQGGAVVLGERQHLVTAWPPRPPPQLVPSCSSNTRTQATLGLQLVRRQAARRTTYQQSYEIFVLTLLAELP